MITNLYPFNPQDFSDAINEGTVKENISNSNPKAKLIKYWRAKKCNNK